MPKTEPLPTFLFHYETTRVDTLNYATQQEPIFHIAESHASSTIDGFIDDSEVAEARDNLQLTGEMKSEYANQRAERYNYRKDEIDEAY